MKWFGVAIIYLGFYGLIGAAVYWTKSAMPLWGLLITPSFSTNDHPEDSDSTEVS